MDRRDRQRRERPAERTGATVVAEGIEAEHHIGAAVAMGARFGQGWRFRHPELQPPLSPPRTRTQLAPRTTTPASADLTPVEVIERTRQLRVASKENLLAISLHLENEARGLGERAVLLGTFQTSEHFTASTHRRYEEIARGAAFVAAFGVGMDAEPAAGVRGAALSDNDDLRGEWSSPWSHPTSSACSPPATSATTVATASAGSSSR